MRSAARFILLAAFLMGSLLVFSIGAAAGVGGSDGWWCPPCILIR